MKIATRACTSQLSGGITGMSISGSQTGSNPLNFPAWMYANPVCFAPDTPDCFVPSWESPVLPSWMNQSSGFGDRQ